MPQPSPSTLAPIVLFVFNRPVHTAKVLSALASNVGAPESALFIYSDAPRGAHDEESVAAVRQLVNEAVGFGSVTVVERPCNYGCGRNELSAISEMLDRFDRCIVVEDDVETSPLFLSYMNRALDVYANDERFYSIGAYAYPFEMPPHYKEETFMSQRNCSWGWATWRRAWNLMDFDCEILDRGMAEKSVRKSFAKACGADWLRTYQRIPRERMPEIWDIRLTFQAWKLGLFALYPVVPFTRNIGKDGSGVNYDAGSLISVDTKPLADCIPAFNVTITEDPRVREAFLKPMKKPLWRRIAIWVARSLGIYDTLLARVNRRQ